jgi:ABC-type nickel/cobalt efflux system permease component RcnA
VEKFICSALELGRESNMGMWIELGIFLLVIVWGLWQLHDVKKARAQTQADKAQAEKAQQARDPGSP